MLVCYCFDFAALQGTDWFPRCSDNLSICHCITVKIDKLPVKRVGGKKAAARTGLAKLLWPCQHNAHGEMTGIEFNQICHTKCDLLLRWCP